MPECSDRNSAANTFTQFLKKSRDLIRDSSKFGCHVPCSETNYPSEPFPFHKNSWIEPYETSPLPDDVFIFGFSYSTLLIEEQITTLVYDFGALMSAAGGNLVLFLGFSCLTGFLSLIEYLQDKVLY